MGWNTQKIPQLIDLPAHRRPGIHLSDIVAIGPVATRHINFTGVLNFPLEEWVEPVLRAPVRAPVAE